MSIAISQEIRNIIHNLREIKLSLQKIKAHRDNALRNPKTWQAITEDNYKDYAFVKYAMKLINEQIEDSEINAPIKVGEIVPFDKK